MNFREVAEKMVAVETRIAKEKGPLNLFALFQREDSPGYFDVIVAADWAIREERQTRRYLAELFGEELERDEEFALNALGILDPAGADVQAVSRFARVEHGLVEVRDEDIYGVTIRRAYFITCKWPATAKKGRRDSTASNAARPVLRRRTMRKQAP